jgi:alanine dehydrogenase
LKVGCPKEIKNRAYRVALAKGLAICRGKLLVEAVAEEYGMLDAYADVDAVSYRP